MGGIDDESGPQADPSAQKLIDEFHSYLEESVILAIIGDYDLTKDFDGARDVLLSLSKDVPTEEDTGFNPSGINYSAEEQVTGPSGPESRGDSLVSVTEASELQTSTSSRTDVTDHLRDGLESLKLWHEVDTTTLADEDKERELAIMFPLLKKVDITFALKKAGGDFSKACEDLLNAHYLEENGLRPKGINGAFRPEDETSFKKNRRMHHAFKNKSGRGKLGVNYRLAPANLDADEDGATTARATPRISPAVSSVPSVRSSPPTRSPVTSPSPSTSTAPNSPSGWQNVPAKPKSFKELHAISSGIRSTSNQSFAAANAAYRRGKSDALYRPVAGILAERGREQAARARAAESETYDALVDEQSSGARIDLHGVPVADGVRIALERTREWWVGLGEERMRRTQVEGFTVVTGLGTHSAGGVSRLRQEVAAALKREGWRVRTETGKFVVTGRQ